MKTRTLLIMVAFLVPRLAYADTKLLGLDVAEASAPSCWASARSMNHWKMAKYQAVATGTVSYFKHHVPADTSVAGCTHDHICWAIYEGDNSTVPTGLKAYGCDSNYDWTVRGVGVYHMFPPTVVVTDLTVTAGSYYWLTHYSYALHENLWANAGCGAQVLSHRGNNEPCEQPLYKRVCSNGNCTGTNTCNEGVGEFPPPPHATCFQTDIASFYDLSVWSAETECPNGVCDVGETCSTCPADCGVCCGNDIVDPGETCDPPSSCPTTCNDSIACTYDSLAGNAANCTAICSFTPITACDPSDGCCPANCAFPTDTDCPNPALCGNGTIDPLETCDPPSSCPTSCDDSDACTLDLLAGSASNCTAACSYPPITACSSNDGCCPPGCTSATDLDCAVDGGMGGSAGSVGDASTGGSGGNAGVGGAANPDSGVAEAAPGNGLGDSQSESGCGCRAPGAGSHIAGAAFLLK